MWIKESDGEKVYKKPYMSINEIDKMDIFFYLDLRIYQLKQENKENTKNYDKMGL
ncbi:hypothetical protein KYB31_09115 [Clostridium felsineum]|uniref:hypothetical protein n=1 Tax=Clostridium felsineum TaxID=36839 RepID=UPI00214DC7F1|nr:hypothetical protein [Clostridium felsineum]MCR3759148.1 hypothetical protein [Clostridium felsineum]